MKIRKRLIVTLFTGIMTIVALVNMKNGDVTMANAEQEINYPYIENISNSNGILTITNPFNVEFQYSTNGLDWETNSNGTIQIEVNTGSKIYLISNFNSISNNTNPCKFSTNFDYSVGGNASYLLSNNDNNVIKSYRFASLFVNSTTLQSVSKNFLNNIQITSDSRSCYSNMFSGCANLINAPDLPSSSTASYCYSGMFKNCSSLIEMPQIGATSMMTSSCSSMFEGCENLTKAKPLFADNLNSSAVECYYAMFRNCISLKSAPKLLATNLSEVDQYKYMFQGCSSLCEIYVSYKGYFGGDISRNWVSSVAETGIFYYDGVDTTRGTSNIPTGWEIKPISEYVEKIDANDIAKEFNNNIDLYCKGGINPTLTGENSVSSTWATASKQYSHLSDEEKEKFVGGQIEKIDSISFANNNTGSTIEFGQSSYSTYEPSDWDSSNFSSGYELLNFTDYKNCDENFYKTTYSDDDYNAPCIKNNDNRLCITCNFVNFGIKQNTLKDCNKIVITYDIDSINNRFGFFCTRYNHLTYSVNGVTKTKAFDYDITIGKNKTITLDVEENADILGIRFGLEADGDVFDLYLKSIEFYQTYESIYPIEEPFASFVKKYDYLYEKYGSNTEMNLDNFLNRDVTPYSSRKNLFNIKDVNDSTWIIAVVSIIGLTSVGAYFFYRKRKEE